MKIKARELTYDHIGLWVEVNGFPGFVITELYSFRGNIRIIGGVAVSRDCAPNDELTISKPKRIFTTTLNEDEVQLIVDSISDGRPVTDEEYDVITKLQKMLDA